MEPPPKPTSALFEVYLRLRPQLSSPQLYPTLSTPDRFLTVEDSTEQSAPTHITLNPPNDNRRRAVEKFGFTQVFEEEASQIDVFDGTGLLPLLEGALGSTSQNSRDGLLATLGVTGSGKTHTILGSKSQRGLTQLSLDILFRSIQDDIVDTTASSLHASVAAADPSEAQVLSAQGLLDALYGVDLGASRNSSRATTPQIVRQPNNSNHPSSIGLYPTSGSMSTGTPTRMGLVRESAIPSILSKTFQKSSFMTSTTSTLRKNNAKSPLKGETIPTTPTKRRPLLRPSTMPQLPDISGVTIPSDPKLEYAVLISMYEVYNDRIFDLLVPGNKTASAKDFRRRPLLFKPTEQSPDRKVVAGLRKVICGNMREALMVLEAGLQERRVAGTGSNSVSSRSHGFFCIEVKKRRKGRSDSRWIGSALTIVDLAGSERARDAKTQGTTLQEAGKINESLMYLGQCLQMQSDIGTTTKPNLVPFRQCKLTELLFSNSFPSNASASSSHHYNPQKAIMIVTADPAGDFNATSQILRYSALAREVTVPRTPSVASQIMSGTPANHGAPRTYYNCGRSTPSDTERETMEIAALEIARMSEEIDGLRREVDLEQQKRYEVEAHLQSAKERILEMEMEIREECYNEMEERMRTEMMRWKAIWAEEADRNDEHMDRKIDILTRGIRIHEDAPEIDTRVEELEDENMRLRQQVAQLQRQFQQRSPCKKIVLGERENRMDADGMAEEIGKLRIVSAGSPVKKMRKLGGKKWALDEEEYM